MNQARISIKDLKFYGFHGVYPEERVVGTTFRADLDISLNPALEAFHDDCLDHAVNYETIVREILHIGSSTRFNLIERLALVMADAILAHPGVLDATVTVHKLVKGMTPDPQWVAVTVSKANPSV